MYPWGYLWRFSIEGASIPIESVFIIFASIYNRIAFIQNTCLYTSTPERKGQNRDKVQNMMYEIRTKSKDKIRKDKTSCKQHTLNRDRYNTVQESWFYDFLVLRQNTYLIKKVIILVLQNTIFEISSQNWVYSYYFHWFWSTFIFFEKFGIHIVLLSFQRWFRISY
jgi:hypothetical protein